MISGMTVDPLLVSSSSGQSEVVQADDAEHGEVDAVAFQTAVAEDLPGLHEGEGVLDADADFAAGDVVSAFQAGSSVWPSSRRCGMTRPVPR